MSLQILEWDSFDPLTEAELKQYAEKLEKVDDCAEIRSRTTSGHKILPPFYDNVSLVEFTDPTWSPKGVRLCYLDHDGELYRLNGTSPPIHEVNAKAPVKIDDDNILIYLVFFCFFVRGEEGPFFVLEHDESPFLPSLVKDMEIIEKTKRPKTWGKDEANWRVSGTVFYSNAVFAADFVVQPSGMIEMLEDFPILADLPDKVSAPLIIDGIVSS